jgi:hypothetical protein
MGAPLLCLHACTETSEKSLSLGLDYRLRDHNPNPSYYVLVALSERKKLPPCFIVTKYLRTTDTGAASVTTESELTPDGRRLHWKIWHGAQCVCVYTLSFYFLEQ